ncbi:threonine--tRNA ligase mitochondrial [Tripterygium wilfordii]|uniref:threonine--tRNA ligase n=1 Tax=Tripterygium wilfordii TaxID=458696 RepID=A0A7J7D410_TRIWF|nr:threonine--tRNA ligase, mitochondrial 1-like [Tripterygium wilfordii]KAF5741053.1 threonine--tRNA ligase mitochondrial [Tripterygium wilfordii]
MLLCSRFLPRLSSSIRRRYPSSFLVFSESSFLRLFCNAAASSSVSNSASMASHPKDEAYLQAVIPKRIKFFEFIQSQQLSRRQSLPHDPIKITLPDGAVKEGKRWDTSPMDIAKGISKGLAAEALISSVNGVLWDMTRPLEDDCDLKFFKFNDDEGRDTLWHSSAHILGQSLEMEYGCKLCIGPCTTRGEGFYYDAFYGDLGLNDDHFNQIQAGAAKAVGEKQPFERIEVTRDQALEIFSDNTFKVEIIKDLPEDKTITVYRCGPLVDLCRGPHIPNTSFVKAFACLKASSAYWRGNKDRESLQRVYGISYPDAKRLKEYLHQLEEAKKYDHRLLGMKQELFFCDPLSPGSWFFLPHGALIYNKLTEFIRSQYRKRGYQEVITPNIYNMKLWETSGHAANYKENMFLIEIEKQEFGLKPMNCPGHCVMFGHRVRSYRELPLRLADFGALHRNEASGALTGLTRVRRFQQDDAHIFCRESQIKDEVRGVLEFIDYVYRVFGFNYELKLSTRPEKYLGDLATWDKAEAALTEALNEFDKPWQMNEGDGAFYGPKIDISVSDALNRKFQCATLQLDFQLPQRFDLEYSAEDEAKRERPVMIHRAILGSVERMFAILLEHYKGKWPFWLSPRQAIVCPVSEKSQAYALQVQDQIFEAGFHVDADTTDRKIQKKVREAQLAQYNYILVVGEEEAKTGQVSVRVRDKADHSVMSVESLLQHFKDEAAAYH